MTTPSPVTVASNLFVAERVADATSLGGRLAELVGRPDEFVEAIDSGFAALADPAYVDGERRVAPGLGAVLGVRQPLIEATYRAFKKETPKVSTALLLDVDERLLAARPMELRWFAIWDLGRCLPTDPERTWQLLRRAAGEASEWITVDTLAHPYGEGILREPRRWAEFQTLIYSPSRWERRLVGSTLATMPFARGMPGGRETDTAQKALTYVAALIGDPEPDVQKALSWALRNLAAIDTPAVVDFLERETATARATSDGNRAWVIRDSLAKIPADKAAALKAALEGIRRRPRAPSTSRAAEMAALLNTGPTAGASGAAGASTAATNREE